MTTAVTVIEAKIDAGPDAYLWLHSSGDCILWPSEEAATGDDGRDAIARWTVTGDDFEELLDSGEVDSLN